MHQRSNAYAWIFPTLHNKKSSFLAEKRIPFVFFGVCSAGGARSLDLRIMNPTL